MKKITLLFCLLISSLSFSQIIDEDFEGGLSLPSGWTINDIAGGGEIWTFVTGGEAVGYNPPNTIYYEFGLLAGNYALFDSDGYGGSIAEDAALESPAFDASGASNVILEFNHFFTSGFGGEGYVEVFDGTSWVQVAFYTGTDQNDSSFGLETIDITAEVAAATNAQVRFRWVGDFSWGWAVDNVVVTAPSCLNPSDFVLGTGGITATSAEIEWTDSNGAGTVFDIEFGLDGFTPGSGTVINDWASTSYNFMGLTPDTAYDFYITANCTGGNGDSELVGPISFLTAFECSNYGLPFNEDWASENAFNSCYTLDNANMDTLSWTFNSVNDFDGDGTNDNVINIFPQAANVAKDDWIFTPVISGVANADYMITVRYNGVDINATANESFDLVITDSPSSMATMQTVIGSYSGITQQGVFGDMTGNDFLTQAYTSSETYTPTSSGDFYIGIHANTTAANSDVFLVSSIVVSETLSDNEFERNAFSHYYDENLQTLNLESSNLPLTGIEIFSTLGQSVVNRPLSKKSEIINVSDLSPGVYLAKVEIDGNFKTLKFIRK